MEQTTKQFRRMIGADDERYNAVTAEWRSSWYLKTFAQVKSHPKNPIVMMMDLVRGNISNFSQLAGMRGLMVNS